ncbi:MAG: hypothetical protein AAF789_02555 [Bacteroidota bacterium]
MLYDLKEMPDSSRIWIYQAERRLTPDELIFVDTNTRQFLSNWKAHGMELNASYQIAYDQFLILILNEADAEASGCSIDASVHLIKALEERLGISFITSDKVAFLQEDEVELVAFSQIKEMVKDKKIIPESLVFNNTIKTLGELKSQWLVESGSTWTSRYFR